MFEHVFASANLPFAVALGLMLAIALTELISLLFGATISGFVDTLLPEIDGPDFDIDGVGEFDAAEIAADGQIAAPDPGVFIRVLSWMNFGRVPALVLLIVFLTAFGLAGIAVQGLSNSLIGGFMAPSLAAIPALIVGVAALRYIGAGLAKIMPKDQTSAISHRRFIGKVAEVIRGEAKVGFPAEAKFTDRYGVTHYVLVEPDKDDDVYVAGTEVLLVRQDGARFQAIRLGKRTD